MPRHTELASIRIDQGNYRFCLDSVVRNDEDNRTEYAFVWRGTSASPEGFVPKPAYFNGELLGRTIRQAFANDKLPDKEIGGFVRGLFGTAQ